MGSFHPNLRMYELKIYREFCVMTSNNAKFEGELTCYFKIGMGIWQILIRALKSVKYLHFKRLILKKVYVWAKNVQTSYVFWH